MPLADTSGGKFTQKDLVSESFQFKKKKKKEKEKKKYYLLEHEKQT